MKVGGEYYFYHNDHLGTPQKMTAVNGAVVWAARYDSFGKADVDAGSMITNNLRFPGQYLDSETGLHYNYFRYYDPASGSYLTSDPIGLVGGINLYIYVLNNSINLTDPSGLKVKIITSDPTKYKILRDAYTRVTSTKKGIEICDKLEKSPDSYQIMPINKDAFYCPAGTKDPACQGQERTVFIDPYNNVYLPETTGLEETPKAVVLGHELGHANGEHDDGPDAMNNVNINENPIRKGLGEPPRTQYYVPKIKWTPGTK